jgi:hypothetical protein
MKATMAVMSSVEQQEHDPCSDDELDEPEDEDDDAPGQLGSPGACPGGASTLGLDRVTSGGLRWSLRDDRPVDLLDGHVLLQSPSGIRGKRDHDGHRREKSGHCCSCSEARRRGIVNSSDIAPL